ncbi:hypothetical protein V7S43_015659 [Phytophthora oleae]|uniref:Uncharacterized protein n=1 Tax=Phytophthora oleae TaxID=2107226 RepID=A0ABD3EY35_9STRA
MSIAVKPSCLSAKANACNNASICTAVQLAASSGRPPTLSTPCLCMEVPSFLVCEGLGALRQGGQALLGSSPPLPSWDVRQRGNPWDPIATAARVWIFRSSNSARQQRGAVNSLTRRRTQDIEAPTPASKDILERKAMAS